MNASKTTALTPAVKPTLAPLASSSATPVFGTVRIKLIVKRLVNSYILDSQDDGTYPTALEVALPQKFVPSVGADALAELTFLALLGWDEMGSVGTNGELEVSAYTVNDPPYPHR